MGIRVGVQVSKRGLYTHIHLDYTRVEFLSCIKIYIYIYIYKLHKLPPLSSYTFFLPLDSFISPYSNFGCHLLSPSHCTLYPRLGWLKGESQLKSISKACELLLTFHSMTCSCQLKHLKGFEISNLVWDFETISDFSLLEIQIYFLYLPLAVVIQQSY